LRQSYAELREIDVAENFLDLNQEKPANHIVTTFIRIFQILELPVVRVAGVIMRAPELGAMNAVSQKGTMNISEVYE
jgi:hypothetical protein